MRSLLLILAVVFAIPSARAADNWPQFRGPTGDGRAGGAAALAVTWDETKNVRWKTPIHDKGWASPVIWGDQIWMTTARADGKEMFAVCVDRNSGKILHDIKVWDVEKPEFCIPFNSYASPTPVIEKGRVYVHFGTYGTACIDTATGKKLWENHELHCDHFRGPGSSPILYGKLLILLFDGYDVQFVAALDKDTGKLVWKQDRNIKFPDPNKDLRKAYATAAVYDIGGSPQLICPAAEATIAYEPNSGKEIWRVITGGMNEAAQPLFGHGLVFLTTGHTQQLWALRPEGSGNITSKVQWKFAKGVPTRPGLILDGDSIFMVNDGGVASCVDAKTGEQVWQERLGGQFTASPILAAGRLYFADQAEKDGTTVVIEAARKFKKLAANKLPDGCMSSPAVAGKFLFIRTRTTLYCIEEK